MTSVLIMSAGSSHRMQGADKQLLLLGGKPVLRRSVEAFLADYLPKHPGVTVDYIHGESAAIALAANPAKPATAILLPDFAKADLFKGVVLGGVLPRKTFSMGHAEEKRYYNECRVIGL